MAIQFLKPFNSKLNYLQQSWRFIAGAPQRRWKTMDRLKAVIALISSDRTFHLLSLADVCSYAPFLPLIPPLRQSSIVPKMPLLWNSSDDLQNAELSLWRSYLWYNQPLSIQHTSAECLNKYAHDSSSSVLQQLHFPKLLLVIEREVSNRPTYRSNLEESPSRAGGLPSVN